MSLNISDTQRMTVWEVEDKGTFALVRASTSRKDKKTDTWVNSNWSFIRFVGTAYKKAIENNLTEKDRIVLKGATLAQEPWVDDTSTKQYPKHPQFTVFNWDYAEASTPATGMDKAPVVESDDSEEAPF